MHWSERSSQHRTTTPARVAEKGGDTGVGKSVRPEPRDLDPAKRLLGLRIEEMHPMTVAHGVPEPMSPPTARTNDAGTVNDEHEPTGCPAHGPCAESRPDRNKGERSSPNDQTGLADPDCQDEQYDHRQQHDAHHAPSEHLIEQGHSIRFPGPSRRRFAWSHANSMAPSQYEIRA